MKLAGQSYATIRDCTGHSLSTISKYCGDVDRQAQANERVIERGERGERGEAAFNDFDGLDEDEPKVDSYGDVELGDELGGEA